MRKMYIIVSLASLFAAQAVFAHQGAMKDDSACGSIAKACAKAGYEKSGKHRMGFWFDCMKPVILGKTVKGVTIDTATAKTCRTAKIEELKTELTEFQNVSG